MLTDDEYVVQIKDEQEDFYSNDDIYNISSWGADLSFRELIHLYDDNELVKPELQRKYVWDKTEASRFIDSILLGLPVPSIFLAKQTDEKMLIVDGYQRLMTVRDFVKGTFSGDGKIFKLSKSDKINERWRGKAFLELSETEQRKIRNTTIHSIIFVQQHPKSDDTGMYQVFERINTSGRTLQPQEIRNCVYQGELNTLLFELNNQSTWRNLFGRPEEARMRDLEFILRFLAMAHTNFRKVKQTSISLKKFLNEFMGKEKNNSSEMIEIFRKQFTKTTEKVFQILGTDAFFNISQTHQEKIVKKFNPTIFDSIMIGTLLAIEHKYKFNQTDYKNKRLDLLANNDYQNVISTRTTNVENINKRISLVMKYLFNIQYEQL